MARKIKISIHEKVIKSIKAYIKVCPKEISGYGEVRKIKDPTLLHCDLEITKLFPLPKQVCSGTYTGIGTSTEKPVLFDDFEAYVEENIPTDPTWTRGQLLKKKNKFAFWWHSHVDMGAFWSGTDEANCNEWSRSDVLVSMVMNKKSEYKLRVDTYTPFRHTYEGEDLEIIVIPEDDTEFLIPFKAEVEAKVSSPSYAPTSSSGKAVVIYNGRDEDDYGEYPYGYHECWSHGWKNGNHGNSFNRFNKSTSEEKTAAGCVEDFVEKQFEKRAKEAKEANKSRTEKLCDLGFLTAGDVVNFFKDAMLILKTDDKAILKRTNNTITARPPVNDLLSLFKGSFGQEAMINTEFLDFIKDLNKDIKHISDAKDPTVKYIENRLKEGNMAGLTLFTRLEYSVISVFLHEDLEIYLLTHYPNNYELMSNDHDDAIADAVMDEEYRPEVFGELSLYPNLYACIKEMEAEAKEEDEAIVKDDEAESADQVQELNFDQPTLVKDPVRSDDYESPWGIDNFYR